MSYYRKQWQIQGSTEEFKGPGMDREICGELGEWTDSQRAHSRLYATHFGADNWKWMAIYNGQRKTIAWQVIITVLGKRKPHLNLL